MIAPRTWLTLALGAIAGAGVSVAALSLRRGPRPCEASFDDGGSRAALRARASSPTGGTFYRVWDAHQSKERCLVDAPQDGSRVISFPIDGGHEARVLGKEQVRRILFRNLEHFLSSWRPVAEPVLETVDGRLLLRSTWGDPDDDGWARRDVWVDAVTRAFVRLLDRTRDGHTIHGVEVLSRPPVPFDPVRTIFHVSYSSVREPRLNPRTVPGFDDFARQVGIALYVPSRLPVRMERVDYGYEDRPFTSAGARIRLPVAWVSYADGVSSMIFVCAEPADLDLITEISNKDGRLARDMACPSLPADAPEDLVGGDGKIRVRRRTNGCLTVLRRDGLPGGVSVLLACQGGMPADVPVQVIRTVVRYQTLQGDRGAAAADGSPASVGSPDAVRLPEGSPGMVESPGTK